MSGGQGCCWTLRELSLGLLMPRPEVLYWGHEQYNTSGRVGFTHVPLPASWDRSSRSIYASSRMKRKIRVRETLSFRKIGGKIGPRTLAPVEEWKNACGDFSDHSCNFSIEAPLRRFQRCAGVRFSLRNWLEAATHDSFSFSGEPPPPLGLGTDFV